MATDQRISTATRAPPHGRRALPRTPVPPAGLPAGPQRDNRDNRDTTCGVGMKGGAHPAIVFFSGNLPRSHELHGGTLSGAFMGDDIHGMLTLCISQVQRN